MGGVGAAEAPPPLTTPASTRTGNVLFQLDGKSSERCVRGYSNKRCRPDALHLGGRRGHAGEVSARPASGDM